MRELRATICLRARGTSCRVAGLGIESLSRLPRRHAALSSTSQLGFACETALTGCVGLAGVRCRFGLALFCFGSFGTATGASFGVSQAPSVLPPK
jgi:hypothetical protein